MYIYLCGVSVEEGDDGYVYIGIYIYVYVYLCIGSAEERRWVHFEEVIDVYVYIHLFMYMYIYSYGSLLRRDAGSSSRR